MQKLLGKHLLLLIKFNLYSSFRLKRANYEIFAIGVYTCRELRTTNWVKASSAL